MCRQCSPRISSHRQSRRLYVGNIPFGVTEKEMADFFNRQINKAHLTTAPGDAVLAVQINMEKNFAFLEFRSIEECTNGMAFDGIVLNGQSLKLRRPKDYAPLPGTLDTSMGMMASQECPTRLHVAGLPSYLKEEQVRELLLPFGDIMELTLVSDVTTGEFKGHAYCEYSEPPMAEQAILGLNDLEIGDAKLVVKRTVMASSIVAPISLPPATRVLMLMNMVTPEELVDDDDYNDILDDVKEECSKYGAVKSTKIPRSGPGLGKIYVEFDTEAEAQKAAASLTGRKFANRTVAASFHAEDRYAADDFDE